MRKQYYVLIAVAVLTMAVPVLGQGGREGQPDAAMAICDSCSFIITDDTTSFGNWGLDYTESEHSFYIDPYTYTPSSVYLTFFLHEACCLLTEVFVFDDDCDVSHESATVTGGVWHHYEWTNITGSVPTATPMLTFKYVTHDCPDPEDSLHIDLEIKDSTAAGWHNQLVDTGNVYDPGTMTDGRRYYLAPEVKITVVGPNDATGDTVAIGHQGDTVAITIWEDTISFAPDAGWIITVGIDGGLHYADWDPTYHSGYDIHVDTSVANEIKLTGNPYSYHPGPSGDVVFGTLHLYLDPDETDLDTNYRVYIKGDHYFYGCATFADTGNSTGDTVLVRIPDVAAEWKIASRSVNKGTQNFPILYYLKSNALVYSDDPGTSVNLSFTIDTSGLSKTTYNGITTQYSYNGGTIYWQSVLDEAPYVLVQEDPNFTSAAIDANSGYEQVGELISDAGSVCGTDTYPFATDTDARSRVKFKYADTTLYATDDSLTFVNGSVTVTGCTTPPSCPALYVWTGETYVLEDFVLTHSQYSRDPQPKDDFLPVLHSIVEDNGYYKVQIREFENEITFLDEVELVVVDYPSQSRIGISIDGKVFTRGEMILPIKAVDHSGKDVLELVGREDGALYEVEGPGELVLTYENKNRSQDDQRFAVGLTSGDPVEPKGEPNAIADGADYRMDRYAEVEDADGNWHYLGGIAPREYTTLSSQWCIDGRSTDLGETFRVRISWQHGYSADVQALEVHEPEALAEHRLTPVEATHTTAGKINYLLASSDQQTITLTPGETIDMLFRAPERIRGYHPNRAFFFKANGYYKTLSNEQALPTAFTLGDNYPNPFNPSTNVWLSIPEKGEVTLKVYNVLGQEVKTVHSGVLDAGRHFMTWNGDADDGQKVASGVYFFRMDAGGISQSKKIMLVK